MVTFKVNDYNGLTLSLQLILLPKISLRARKQFQRVVRGHQLLKHTHFIHNFWEQHNNTLWALWAVVVVVTFDGNGATPFQQNKSVLYRKDTAHSPV